MATAAEQKAIVDQHTLQARHATRKMGPLYKMQKLMRTDRGATGPIWVCRTSLPAPPESDLRDRLSEVFRHLGEGTERIDEPVYFPEPLHLEWTGRRGGLTDPKAPEPNLSDGEKYQRLQQDTGNGPTVLYIQGGGLFLGSTVTARTAVKRLSSLTDARFVTINYRLAPQWTMLHQHLDIITLYFALLSPPPGSLHTSIPPNRIVLAGESAGAILCVGLIQFLLELRRRNITKVRYHGRDVPVVLPSGLAILSISSELTLSISSGQTHDNDWLGAETEPWYLPTWPNEPYWPANPPRTPIWADWSAVAHPLLSSVFYKDWSGCPPVWISLGLGERTSDAARLLVRNMIQQGVKVRWEGYEYMTHAFATVMPKLPQSERCLRSWAEACMRLANGKGLQEGGVHIALGGCEERAMSVEEVKNLTSLTLEEAREKVRTSLKERGSMYYIGQTEPREKAAL